MTEEPGEPTRRRAPTLLLAGALAAALLLTGCGRKVRLESPDGSISLEYACGSGPVARRASSPAEKALVRGFAIQLIHRADRHNDFARASRLAGLFQVGDDSALEQEVVSDLCAGDRDGASHGATFPTRGAAAPAFSLPRPVTTPRAASWLGSHGGTAYPVVMADRNVETRCRVTGVPAMVRVDPDGKVAGYCMGCRSSWIGPDSLAAHLDSLMS